MTRKTILHVADEDGGDVEVEVVLICGEDDDICTVCCKLDELRPYGKNGAMVCYDCAMKDEAEAHRQFKKLLGFTEQ
jgi:hypothetical protein